MQHTGKDANGPVRGPVTTFNRLNFPKNLLVNTDMVLSKNDRE